MPSTAGTSFTRFGRRFWPGSPTVVALSTGEVRRTRTRPMPRPTAPGAADLVRDTEAITQPLAARRLPRRLRGPRLPAREPFPLYICARVSSVRTRRRRSTRRTATRARRGPMVASACTSSRASASMAVACGRRLKPATPGAMLRSLSRGACFGWLAAAAAALCWGLGDPPMAHAARIMVMTSDGHVVVRSDPSVAAAMPTPAPAGPFSDHAVRATARAHAADPNVRRELAPLRRIHAISTGAYGRYLGSFNAALSAARRLHGTRAVELGAVLENLHATAASGMLTPSRLPALFLTLDRNRRWWTTGPLLSSGQRVEFAGSQIAWEYYHGQGIELQELGSWGQADWMFEAGT